VNDPAAETLRRKVALIPDESLRKDECAVLVRSRDGRKQERHIPRASGTVENPMSDKALAEKFLDLAQTVIGPRAAQVLDLVWTLDRLPDAAHLPLLLKG
jgi:2-methylcitrate dehydratase PrpD